MSDWIKVYDLAEDHETIRQGQEATQTSEFFGAEPEIALIGTDEWWQAIEEGQMARHTICGVISRVYMAGHGDWPEFEVDVLGEKSRWTRLGPDELYRIGNEVKIEYISEKLKPHWGSREIKLTLRILIKPVADR